MSNTKTRQAITQAATGYYVAAAPPLSSLPPATGQAVDPRRLVLPVLAVFIGGVVLAFAVGYFRAPVIRVTEVVTVAPAVPAMPITVATSAPSPSAIPLTPARGPLRQYAPMPAASQADREHGKMWLMRCSDGFDRYYPSEAMWLTAYAQALATGDRCAGMPPIPAPRETR